MINLIGLIIGPGLHPRGSKMQKDNGVILYFQVDYIRKNSCNCIVQD